MSAALLRAVGRECQSGPARPAQQSPASPLVRRVNHLGASRRWNAQQVVRTVAVDTATVSQASPLPVSIAPAPIQNASAPISSNTPSTAPASATSTPTYNWLQNWWPVAPVRYFDPAKPSPVTLGGRQLVVWRHATDGWVVQEDLCPHRLAPLSEGRLEAGATRLACSYHGWEFDRQGTCTRIPQLANDPRAATTACSSRRSCVASFPTVERDGVLFAWMDNSPEGIKAKEAAPLPPILVPEEYSPFDWYMNELPNDYTFWLEQGMDPAHANFLHHGLATFRKDNSIPMLADKVTDLDPLNLGKGYTWSHRGYEHANKDMVALRNFHAPFMIQSTYDTPKVRQYICTMQVPVRPGVSRVYTKFGYGPPVKQEAAEGQPAASTTTPAPASGTDSGEKGSKGSNSSMASLGSAVQQQQPTKAGSGGEMAKPTPETKGNVLVTLMRHLFKQKAVGKPAHWLFDFQLISDQDVIMMCRQESVMRAQGLTFRSFYLNSPSDEGVAAVNRWVETAGYPDALWKGQQAVRLQRATGGDEAAAVGVSSAGQYGATTYGTWPEAPLPQAMIFDRYERHVRHCAECQQALPIVTRVCQVLTAGAVAAVAGAAAAVILAAISPAGVSLVGGWAKLGALVAAAVVLSVTAVRSWDWREVRFVTGLHAWKRKGGFSVLDLKEAKKGKMRGK